MPRAVQSAETAAQTAKRRAAPRGRSAVDPVASESFVKASRTAEAPESEPARTSNSVGRVPA